MTLESDPLTVLLKLNSELRLHLDEELIKECYEIQKEHQYDKDRDTLTKIKAIVEERVQKEQGSTLL
jgi:ATP-dependent protease HslVU (ClpYQ) peptidase subunit